MKSLLVSFIFCLGLVASRSALAQHGHLEAGASSAVHGSQLQFVNAEQFASSEGFVQPLVWTDEGPYAGYFHGNITMTVRAATLQRGGPEPLHPALGTQVSVELLAVEGPAGGEFGFWEQGSEAPTHALESGGTGSHRWLLSENEGEAGADPYGHHHGRRFTATDPGIYTVTFRLHDESTHGHENSPLHEPSDPIEVRFIAGDGIPVSVVKGGDYVLGAALSNRQFALSLTEDDGHTDHVHDAVNLEKTVFEISHRWRDQTPTNDPVFNTPGRPVWLLPGRALASIEDITEAGPDASHGGEPHSDGTHGDETHGNESHDDENHGDGAHQHDDTNLREWDGEISPVVEMELEEDPAGGYNVYLSTVGFSFSPENASSHHVPGEGHAHIYVDGVKLGRLYTHRYFLYALPEGQHTVRVTLNANTHEDYTLDGHKIEAVAEVSVSAPAVDSGHDGGHEHGAVVREWDGAELPKLALDVVSDPASGWNLFFDYSGFDLNPRNASRAHVPAEGHTHIYVNEEKITRLYGRAYHLASLPEGDVVVSVRLSANDHKEYTVNGDSLEVTTRIQNGASGEHGGSHEALSISMATESIPSGELIDDSVVVSVSALSGPGEFALLGAKHPASDGGETVLARSDTGVASFSVGVGEVLPLSWAFRQAGDYEIVLTLSGTLVNGGEAISRSTRVSFRVMPSDRLFYSVLGNRLRLTWDNGRPLEAAVVIDGHYVVLSDAHGEYETDVTTGTRFFRLSPAVHHQVE